MTNYLMWFAHYGSTSLVEQPTLEDCYDLDIMLNDADTATFDQYGILCEVEEITDSGARVIPDDEWDAGIEAYRQKITADYDAEMALKPARKSYATISLYPPFPVGHPSRHVAAWEYWGTAYSPEEAEKYKSHWVSVLGKERVRVNVLNP